MLPGYIIQRKKAYEGCGKKWGVVLVVTDNEVQDNCTKIDEGEVYIKPQRSNRQSASKAQGSK